MKKSVAVAIASMALAACQKQSPPASVQASTNTPSASQVEPASAALSAKSYDGPFGLAASMSISDLEKRGFKPADGTPNVYVGKPPKPLEDQGIYAVVATTMTGTCRVIARLPVDVVNGSGDQLKQKTDQLSDLMRIKYGKYTEKLDHIKQDVYRRNPQFWMMGLKEESIYYGYDWNANKTEKPLPGDIEKIEIAAEAINMDSGFVSIQYTFKNFADCRKELDTHKAQNL